MTRKHVGMLQQLLELLASQTLRDWTYALAQVNAEITAQDVSNLKRRLKASIREHETKAGRGTAQARKRMGAAIFPETQENSAVREFLQELGESHAKVQRPLEQDFTKWLEIISAQAESTESPLGFR